MSAAPTLTQRGLPDFEGPAAPPDFAPVLSTEQIERFLLDGCLLVSGLIPKDTARRADDAAFRCNGMDPADPATWRDPPQHEFFEHPDLVACFTPMLMRAAGQLASPNPALFPVGRPPTNAFVIKLMPEPGPWRVRGDHLDGSGWGPGVVEMYPRRWRLFAMIYLHDIEPHGGGTVVYPGSHRKAEALARSDPGRYMFVAQLGQDILKQQLGEPLEVSPKAGDVLFLDSFAVHCKPMNCGKRPRFALNFKW